MTPRKPTTKSRPAKDKILSPIMYQGRVYDVGSDVPEVLPEVEVERFKRLGRIGKAK